MLQIGKKYKVKRKTNYHYVVIDFVEKTKHYKLKAICLETGMEYFPIIFDQMNYIYSDWELVEPYKPKTPEEWL